jgi:hypothetical protein
MVIGVSLRLGMGRFLAYLMVSLGIVCGMLSENTLQISMASRLDFDF